MSLEAKVAELKGSNESLETEVRHSKEVLQALNSRLDFLNERLESSERDKLNIDLKLREATESLSKQSEASAGNQARLNAIIDALRTQVNAITQSGDRRAADAQREIEGLNEETRRLHNVLSEQQKQNDGVMEEARKLREERSQKAEALNGETRLRTELEQQRDRLQNQLVTLATEQKQVSTLLMY